MRFPRMPIEAESPEQLGYERLRFNLTESSVRDRALGELGLDLNAVTLCYTDHLGAPELRALIAARAGGGLVADDILITAGASAALFIVALTLLDQGDHLIIERPNYATNIETPKSLGRDIDYVDLDFDKGFALDVDDIAARLRPTTRLISLTTPHNPTGVSMSGDQLAGVVSLAERVGAYLLVDETYRDMSFGAPPPVAATLSERAISVCSLSKSYGVPGIRSGWIACRDKALMHRFLCAKEQIGICGSVVDEAIAAQVLRGADDWLTGNRARLADAIGTVEQRIASEGALEWVRPDGGCVCLPRIRADARVDVAAFYRTLNDDHGAWVGPGRLFEQPDRYFRIGYGWPTPEELAGGLAAISAALRAAGGGDGAGAAKVGARPCADARLGDLVDLDRPRRARADRGLAAVFAKRGQQVRAIGRRRRRPRGQMRLLRQGLRRLLPPTGRDIAGRGARSGAVGGRHAGASAVGDPPPVRRGPAPGQ